MESSDDRRTAADRAFCGFSALEVVLSAGILTMVFYAALSGYAGTLRASTSGSARLDSMANSAGALTAMNLELQEASVRDESVEIYWIDPQTGVITGPPQDPAAVPPPQTVYPSDEVVGQDSFALRFMTVGDFTALGDSVSIEEDGPFLYRLGTGAPTDFARDKLVRIDESGEEPPRVLCRGVQQLVFQRDSRGGAIRITLVTTGRDTLTGNEIPIRQVVTVTPKNDFSSNLANYQMNGEQL